MKKIGIVVADENEISSLPWKLKEIKKIKQFSFQIFTNGIIIVHSGIGFANAASATQQLISSFEIEQIWNYGAVGASDKLKLFDLVAPRQIYYHDVITPWHKRGQISNEKSYFINNLKLENNYNLASGSSFVAETTIIKAIKKEIDVDIFDMEAAAIAQIADKNKIAFFIIKCVSDIIGITKATKIEINKNIAHAGKRALEFVIKKINKQEERDA